MDDLINVYYDKKIDNDIYISKCHQFGVAKKIAKQLLKHSSELQVTYGTRVKKFCFIDKSDRDYNKFGISLKKFVKLDKHWAKEFSLRPSIWR